MVKLHQIRIERSALDNIPAEERTLLVLLAHAANELNILAKIFHWAAAAVNESPIELKGNNTLVFTVVRLLTGKLYEAWKLLDKAFFGTQLFRTYTLALDDEGRSALQDLKQYFGRKNAIEAVRNRYAFHYSPDQVTASYSAVPEGEELDLFLGDSGLNTLYYFAEVIANRALLYEINSSNPAAAMEQLRLETTRIHAAFLKVISGLMALAVKNHLGKTLYEMGASEVEISPCLTSKQVSIPFFVELDD